MGMDINVHDQRAVESPGHIYDRSKEHLVTADKGIITYRRSLIKAINGLIEGKPAPFLFQREAGSKLRGPIAIDTTADIHSWNDDWKSQNKNKREHSTWAKGSGT